MFDAVSGESYHRPAQRWNAPDAAEIITQVLSIARRRKWLIAGCVVGALLLGLVATLLMTPQYRASATLEIQRENSSMIRVGQDPAAMASVDQEFYETQYGLLQAGSLAERVAQALRLGDDAKFFEKFGYGSGASPQEVLDSVGADRDTRIRVAGEILLDHFSVDHSRLSRLVNIHFESPDPQFSKRVIDAWSANFIRMTLERRYDATAYARDFLENRIEQLRTRINESEQKVVDYAAQQQIINLPSTGGTGGEGGTTERPLVAEDLAILNQQLVRATADRIEAESRLRISAGESSEGLENQAISRMREQRASLAAEYARMMVQFEPTYPPAMALQSQLTQMDRAIAREESRISGSLRQTYEASLAREQQLRKRVDELKQAVLDSRRRSIQYNIYQRDADTNRQLYDALLQQYKEIGVAGGVGATNISVVDAAEVPLKPSSPKIPLNLALALMAGLLLGAGAAWALEQIDQGITDPGEVETDLGVPLLGTIPTSVETNILEALDDRKSGISEAYVSLRTRLSFATDHGVPRTLAVTSSRPAEGKSTSAYALALSLARSQKRVVLIDADMRSPTVHHEFNISNTHGLSNYLSGSDDLAQAVKPSSHERLHVMPAGPPPPSAPELLAGERFNTLVMELLEQFDHIVFDAPPVMGLADAPLLASRVEGVVYVVEAHGTQKSMVRVALNRLIDSNAQIFGAVLTKFDPQRAHYGYGYDYGYGYGYGQSDGSKT